LHRQLGLRKSPGVRWKRNGASHPVPLHRQLGLRKSPVVRWKRNGASHPVSRANPHTGPLARHRLNWKRNGASHPVSVESRALPQKYTFLKQPIYRTFGIEF